MDESEPGENVLGFYLLEGTTLGRGKFCSVELARHLILDSQVALKIVDTARFDAEYPGEPYLQEGEFHLGVQHPRIVRLYEVFWHMDLYCLATEYLPRGDLEAYLQAQPSGRICEDYARRIIQDLLSAVDYLHGKRIIHGNISLQNILMDSDMRAKLSDFGLCATHGRLPDGPWQCRALEFTAPEVLDSDLYNGAVDIWSLGVVLYVMVTGCLPFQVPLKQESAQEVSGRRFSNFIRRGLCLCHQTQMQDLSPRCQTAIESMLVPQSFKRISLDKLKKHPFVSGVCSKWNDWISKPSAIPDQYQLFAKLRLSEILGIPFDSALKCLSSPRPNHLKTMFSLLVTGMDSKDKHGSLSDLSFMPSHSSEKTPRFHKHDNVNLLLKSRISVLNSPRKQSDQDVQARNEKESSERRSLAKKIENDCESSNIKAVPRENVQEKEKVVSHLFGIVNDEGNRISWTTEDNVLHPKVRIMKEMYPKSESFPSEAENSTPRKLPSEITRSDKTALYPPASTSVELDPKNNKSQIEMNIDDEQQRHIFNPDSELAAGDPVHDNKELGPIAEPWGTPECRDEKFPDDEDASLNDSFIEKVNSIKDANDGEWIDGRRNPHARLIRKRIEAYDVYQQQISQFKISRTRCPNLSRKVLNTFEEFNFDGDPSSIDQESSMPRFFRQPSKLILPKILRNSTTLKESEAKKTKRITFPLKFPRI